MTSSYISGNSMLTEDWNWAWEMAQCFKARLTNKKTEACPEGSTSDPIRSMHRMVIHKKVFCFGDCR